LERRNDLCEGDRAECAGISKIYKWTLQALPSPRERVSLSRVKRAQAAVTRKKGRESRSGMCVEHDAIRDWRLEAVVQRGRTYDERGGFEARTGRQLAVHPGVRKQGNKETMVRLSRHTIYTAARNEHARE
jgi:hypothetical protein